MFWLFGGFFFQIFLIFSPSQNHNSELTLQVVFFYLKFSEVTLHITSKNCVLKALGHL